MADSYRVIVHPYRKTIPGPPPGGPWLIRCYTDDGEHVHSAEGGVSLHGGLSEVERAIERREAAPATECSQDCRDHYLVVHASTGDHPDCIPGCPNRTSTHRQDGGDDA